MTDDKTDSQNAPANPSPVPPSARRHRGKFLTGSALVGVLLLGAVAGAAIMKVRGHDERQALLPPIALNAMTDDSLVAVKGKVVEMFGNKFIITDATGRALIDTGPSGEGSTLVTQDEEVTVQGRFDDGFVKAGMVIHADGRVDELKPPHRHGPPHGKPDDGPRDHGPDAPKP